MGSEPPAEPCTFADLFELAAKARDDGTYAQQRPGEQWFRAGDAGFLCLWTPQNRTGTKRISHEWVREDRRGEGIKAALLEAAIDAAERSDADRLDIYVYDPSVVEPYGFEPADGGQAHDDAEYYAREL